MHMRNTTDTPVNERKRGAGSLLMLAALLLSCAGAAQAQAVDEAAAQALAKKSGCMKCHAVAAKKDGPSFKDTAAKYKGKADGEQQLFVHMTSSPKIKVDGKEELHESPKTKNEAEIRNLVRFILSR
jgi:cytochrome c